jgi:hypothetical protein
LALGSERRVYDSEKRATDFLRLLLVEHKPDDALNIPTKPEKPARIAS